MKKIKIFLPMLAACAMLIADGFAADLFDAGSPVVDGIKVFEASDTFAEIFEKLDGVKFAGKDIRAVLESLEALSPKVHVAVTDNRVVVVRGDDIAGTWPRPEDKDWRGLGQIATAMLLKIRAADAGLARQSQSALYSMSVAAMTRALDANGRYVASVAADGRVITSAGLEGRRDNRGYWRVNGVIKGSQADAAGINDGDLIVGVNNVDVSRISDPELAAAFAGFNSGTLKLKVMSPSGTKNIVLRRATMVMADADIIWRRGTNTEKQDEGGILEIILYNISENAVSIVNEALAKHSDASGIILDLRVARGGDERAAAKLAGLFLGRAPVMRIDEGNGEEVEVIPGGDAATGASVVVLVSGETTGSAEGVAMAFFEARRGVLAGTPTAGFARLVTKIELSGGGVIELGNRTIKSGRGTVIDGRGVFPLVCLSNIRNNSQQDVFFVNVVNGDFNAKDFNSDSSVNAADVRKGCPAIKSGADEDSVAAAVSMKLLTDKTAYESLIKNVSE